MTVFTALRNATLLAAVAMIGTPSAWAVDPGRAPRNTEPIIPNPQDPYGTFPANPGNPFDPFAPASGLGATFPPGTTLPPGSNEYRVQPNVVPTQPTQPSEPSRWRLGVFSTDTGTGVQIVRLADGPSPARDAGLEPDDTIVTVAGHQVGYVGNVRNELGTEFNAHADADGYVLLLVHDNRSGNLINLPVRLESRFQRIQGTIGLQAGSRLPQDAEAHVALHEIVRQGVVVPLVTTTVTDLRYIPVQFALDVDPSLIDPRRKYVVHADITSGNRTLYTTRNEYRVLGDGYPRTVDMRLYPTSTTGDTQYSGYADNREQQLEQIAAWFREYLNRDLRYNERQVWQSNIDRGVSMNDVQAQLLAHNEFYTQAQRNDRQYIENMYLAVLGRRPQPAEVDAWVRRLEAKNGLRQDIAREFLAQVSKQR
jgi:uncharacterized lipoprotein YbaY